MIVSLEKKEQYAREIRTLGEASNYDGQAAAFVAATDSKIEARFLGMESGHFGPEDDTRDRWEIRISRGARSYTFEYGDSIKNTEERLEELAGTARSYTGAHYRRGLVPFPAFAERKRKEWEKIATEWGPAGKDGRPSAYSALRSLEKYEPPQDVDSFAAEYGYSKPSEALRVHRAVLKAWAEIRALYGEDELELLQEIS